MNATFSRDTIKLARIKLDVNHFQFRTERVNPERVQWLVNNWDDAVVDPLDVYRDEDGNLWLISGHHRHAAACELGKEKIQVRIHQGDLESARIMAATSNASRLEYTPIEYCHCLTYLVDTGMSIEAAAEKMSVKPTLATRYYSLRLLEHTGWANWLNTDLISIAYAVALHAEKSPFNPGELDSLLKLVVDKGLGLAEIKKFLGDIKSSKSKVSQSDLKSLFDLGDIATDRVVEVVARRTEDNKIRMYNWYLYELAQNSADIPDDIKTPLLEQLRRLNSHLIGAEESETIPTRVSDKLRVNY